MATIEPIKIKGLRDLQATLKDLDGESQKLLRVALNDAAETVVAGSRRLVPTRSGKARASIRAASSQREARVSAGGTRAPYFPWLDFGGRVGRKRSVVRRFIPGGRYIYPTYGRNRLSIMEDIERSVSKLISDAGLDGR